MWHHQLLHQTFRSTGFYNRGQAIQRRGIQTRGAFSQGGACFNRGNLFNKGGANFRGINGQGANFNRGSQSTRGGATNNSNSQGALAGRGKNQRGQFGSKVCFNCGSRVKSPISIIRQISASYFIRLLCPQTNLRLMRMGMRTIQTVTIALI